MAWRHDDGAGWRNRLEADRGAFHVLVVEDDPIDREMIAEAVSRLEMGVEFQLTFARDGEEALEGVFSQDAQRTPDLVILDLNMPGIDGWEVLDEMHAEWRLGVPVIVFTTSRSPEDEAYARDRGARAFVSKPSGLSELDELMGAIRDTVR